MKQLIVNADDFGRSPGVTAGALEAHGRGIVTSATVMVLEKAAARGIREAAERAPRLSLGLHFVLTGGGRPASAVRDLPTLAPTGFLCRKPGDLPARIPADEVRIELEAQIDIFQMLARKPPTHLDSHHHVALHASVAPVFAAVARARSLPVRSTSPESTRGLRAAGVRTPDHFIADFHAENVSLAALERILEELPEGTSELMCHPGYADEELKSGSTYADEREWEIEVLCDPRIRELAKSRKIELIGFDTL